MLSGSPEITFNTGAKVTLQGPALFEVDSASGGCLNGDRRSFAWGASRGPRRGDYSTGPGKAVSPTNSPASAREIATHPLFSLGCPVGVLTIRGAEFSVATDELGALFVKVKRGQIALQMPGWGPDEAVAVEENCSAVTSILPYNGGGFRWELYLMGDRPFMVDSTPKRPKRPPVVFRGELAERGCGRTGSAAKPSFWFLEKAGARRRLERCRKDVQRNCPAAERRRVYEWPVTNHLKSDQGAGAQTVSAWPSRPRGRGRVD